MIGDYKMEENCNTLLVRHQNVKNEQIKNHCYNKINPIVLCIKLEDQLNVSNQHTDTNRSLFNDVKATFIKADIDCKPNYDSFIDMVKKENTSQFKIKHLSYKKDEDNLQNKISFKNDIKCYEKKETFHTSLVQYHNVKTEQMENKDNKVNPIVLCIKLEDQVELSKDMPYINRSQTVEQGKAASIIRKNNYSNKLESRTCKICRKVFKDNNILKRHIVLVHSVGKTHSRLEPNKPIKKLKCSICQLEFQVEGYLKRHMTNMHGVSNYEDKQCLLSGSQQCSVKEIKCRYCEKSFQQGAPFDLHLTTSHPDAKDYVCNICGFICSNKKNCLTHKQLHSGEYNFTCAECKISFKSKLSLKAHLISVHESVKKYECGTCGDKFKVKSNLRTHIEVHHTDKNIKKFVCGICSAAFHRRTYLLRHYQTHSQSDRKFTCDICNIKCRSKTDIRRHVQTHFGGIVKPHKCPSCEMSFNKRSKLERHMPVHTGERPYKCKICEKAYKNSGSLKYHANTHVGKTFTCKNCKFSSINESSFKRHLRQNSCKKTIFRCELCEKKLTSRNFLKKHIRHCHSDNLHS